ncbi:MAG: GH1 family beta-glucosidase [Candidatus Eiseniibacteriota bacterium]
MSASPTFPEGFLWGAATSAYQIEGSPLADGAGPSNWHRFTHTPGRTRSGETGDVACDHYRRFADDVRLMQELGLRAYRFSISWSRVMPEGRGAINAKGLAFYSRLVDELLSRGIRPCATLFHWDWPAALDDDGGWLNPESPKWFADYARVVFRALADRVPMWMTINEPWVVVDAGFLHGVHAPGRRSAAEARVAAHHLLLAHGEAVRACRAESDGAVGLVVNLEPKYPASESAEDAAATAQADAYMNRQFLDPVLLGRYPEELREIWGDAWRVPPAADLRMIAEPIDFLGINYYTRGVVRRDDATPLLRARSVPPPADRVMETGWEVHPESLTRVLRWVKERYGNVPLYVTENGAAFADPPVAEGGRVPDPRRVEYLRSHLRAAAAAIEAGVDLRGYFVWSLLDNFEWAEGFAIRFGIVHVDFATQRRTLKDSALFYRDVVATNGAALTERAAR